EEQELRDHDVRDVIIDRRPEEDDAVLEEARKDVPTALAAVSLFDDRRDEIAEHRRGRLHYSDSTKGPCAAQRAVGGKNARLIGQVGPLAPKNRRNRSSRESASSF